MIALLLCLLCPAALAEDLWVTRPGETVETVAAALGDPTLSAQIRALNGLGPTEQPAAGVQLRLPASASLGATPAHVLYLRGEGTVALPGQSTTPLQAGQFLAEGALICVGDDSFATLRLADSGGESHDDLNLLSGTCVRVDRSSASSAERRSLLSVERGSVSVRAATQGTGKVSIRTPSGLTIGERGGFRVTVEPTAARTEAVDHAVAVLGAGVSTPVRAGQGTRVRPGKAPDPPVDLLKAGALLDPEQGALLLRPDFAWLPAPRAVAYRVELSTDPDFAEVVRAEEVGQPAWAPDRLFLPTRVQGLWWRVAPVDRTGFVGLPSETRALLFPPGLGP